MADFSTMALAGQGVQAGSSVLSANTQANAIKAQSTYDQAVAEQNARARDKQAQDAVERGGEDASLIALRARQMQGSQRARLAAQGVDVNSGSALDAQMDVQTMSEMDKLTARVNASREAYGYKNQARGIRADSAMAAMGARNTARSTLLAGYMSGSKDAALGAYYYNEMSDLESKEKAKKKPTEKAWDTSGNK